jgi:uncharacterized membrane protein YccC
MIDGVHETHELWPDLGRVERLQRQRLDEALDLVNRFLQRLEDCLLAVQPLAHRVDGAAREVLERAIDRLQSDRPAARGERRDQSADGSVGSVAGQIGLFRMR